MHRVLAQQEQNKKVANKCQVSGGGTGNLSISIIRSTLVVGQELAQLIAELEDEQAERMMTTGVYHVNGLKSFSDQVLASGCHHRPRYRLSLLGHVVVRRGSQFDIQEVHVFFSPLGKLMDEFEGKILSGLEGRKGRIVHDG